MTRLYQKALIITLAILIFNSNIAQAQKLFTIIDLQKMCEYSLTQMKSYALTQKFSYSTASDEDEDSYFYNDGTSITTIQKKKKKNLLILNIKSEEYYLKIKESLENLGYKYSSTTEGTPTFIYYDSDNYTTVLYVTDNSNSNQEEYHIAVSKKVKVKCEEFTINELQTMCDYSYTDLEIFIKTKGYKVAQTDRSYLMAIVFCNANTSNGLIVNIGKSVSLTNNSYGNKLITQIKTKGYKISITGKQESGNIVSLYSTDKYDADVVLFPDKTYTITISNKANAAPTSSASDNSNQDEDKVIAKKLSSGKIEINSYTNTTDVNIKKGDKINISASGSVTYGALAGSGGPDGIDGYTNYNRIQGFRHGSLLVRIGNNGEWEAVGTSKSIIAKNSGVLQFIVNDGDPSNNSGSFIVEYSINKPMSYSAQTAINSKPSIKKIKDDLIGQKTFGWNFDNLNEFQECEISQEKETNNSLKYYLELLLIDQRDNSTYPAKVVVTYLKNNEGWYFSGLTMDQIIYTKTFYPNKYVQVYIFPNCKWNAENIYSMSWKTTNSNYANEVITGPDKNGVTLPHSSSYYIKSLEDREIKVKFTYTASN